MMLKNNKDNIQSVGITDTYDKAKLEVSESAIKAYDGKSGADVTDKFHITVNNGVIAATLKAGFTKSLGDAENTQVIDTTKFEFGRYYKFVIPAKVADGVMMVLKLKNTAAQVKLTITTQLLRSRKTGVENQLKNVLTTFQLLSS